MARKIDIEASEMARKIDSVCVFERERQREREI